MMKKLIFLFSSFTSMYVLIKSRNNVNLKFAYNLSI